MCVAEGCETGRSRVSSSSCSCSCPCPCSCSSSVSLSSGCSWLVYRDASGVCRGFDAPSSSLGYLDRRDQLLLLLLLSLLEQLVRQLRGTILFGRSGGARRCRKQPRARDHNQEDGFQRGKRPR